MAKNIVDKILSHISWVLFTNYPSKCTVIIKTIRFNVKLVEMSFLFAAIHKGNVKIMWKQTHFDLCFRLFLIIAKKVN